MVLTLDIIESSSHRNRRSQRSRARKAQHLGTFVHPNTLQLLQQHHGTSPLNNMAPLNWTCRSCHHRNPFVHNGKPNTTKCWECKQPFQNDDPRTPPRTQANSNSPGSGSKKKKVQARKNSQPRDRQPRADTSRSPAKTDTMDTSGDDDDDDDDAFSDPKIGAQTIKTLQSLQAAVLRLSDQMPGTALAQALQPIELTRGALLDALTS